MGLHRAVLRRGTVLANSGRLPAELGACARVVVIYAQDSQGHARLIKRREQQLVKQFITQAPIEALDEAILHGFARRDIVPRDPRFFWPAEYRIAGEFRAVVADHYF